jgi:hypothetical protein
MCRFYVSNQPAYSLEAELARVPHSELTNFKLIQRFPSANHPTDQVLFNACLNHAELVTLGRALINES